MDNLLQSGSIGILPESNAIDHNEVNSAKDIIRISQEKLRGIVQQVLDRERFIEEYLKMQSLK